MIFVYACSLFIAKKQIENYQTLIKSKS